MITRSMVNIKLNMFSATRLTNYIKNDCIIDYLDLINSKKLLIDINNLNIIKKRKINHELESECKKKKSSFDYIVENGYIFEENIFEQIKKEMEIKKDLKNFIRIDEKNLNLNYNLTKKILLDKNYDIITGSVLINEENNTFGYPDMIVSGNWIKKYINDYPIEVCNDRSKYYIIDIKSSTITLISKGENVSSKLLYDSYKLQIYVYIKALNKLFRDNNINNDVNIGFILGKKYEYINDKKYIQKQPLERLAVINYNYEKENGFDYDIIINNAINWQIDLNNNWINFNLNPINKDELYPNMKNNYDKNWRNVKKKIAFDNKELTLLWNCGVKQRKNAWDNGIKKFDDPKLNCKILGFKKSNKEKILSQMINILKENQLYILDKQNNKMNWQESAKFEFYVDFETYNQDIIFDENYENMFNDTNILYMIGAGININSTFLYKVFIINYEDNNNLKNILMQQQNLNCDYNCYSICENEKDLINKFTDYIYSFKPNNMNYDKYKKNIRLIHWSFAEPSIFKKKLNQYYLIDDKFNLNWYDLLLIFKDEDYPIIIKECFSFGLKSIVSKLNKYGLLQLKWPELDDGLLSSFIAKSIYKGEINNLQNNNIINITEYNYIDCIALNKILVWMRSNL